MIYNLTHTEDGKPQLRRSVTVKVAIGLPPKGDKGHPTRLDHFVFLRKGVDGNWAKDEDLTKHYGEDCRGFEVTLVDNDPERVFRTELAAYVKRGCWCRGDGVNAQRRDIGTKQKPQWGDFQIYSSPDRQRCAEAGCEDFEKGYCLPSGDLYFMLTDFPTLGSVGRWHTSSYQSIRQVHTALEDIRSVSGGRLMGITARLFVFPDKSRYEQNGDVKTGTKHVVGLELRAQDMRMMTGRMIEGVQAFEQVKLALGGQIASVDEDDEERGAEIAGEFYTVQPDILPADKPVADKAKQDAAEAERLMKEAGLTAAMIEQRLEQYKGRMPELLQKVRDYAARKGATPSPTSGSATPSSVGAEAPSAARGPVSSAPAPASPSTSATVTSETPAASKETERATPRSATSAPATSETTSTSARSAERPESTPSPNIHGLDATDEDLPEELRSGYTPPAEPEVMKPERTGASGGTVAPPAKKQGRFGF